ncbi:MAG: hypothetical protein J1E97_03355 [Muribaculaceae bacterium]|nr:hypothetical protein [Muribaculaceae bacterium]
MKRKNIPKRLIICGIALASALMPQALLANIKGEWVQHPAAALRTQYKFSQIDRILDGNRYVYFVVRSNMLNRGQKYAYATMEGIDPIQIFRYEKGAPWADGSIEGLARAFDLSGALPVAVNYSPERGVLAVAYDNNAIDFISDDGNMVSCYDLRDVQLPPRATVPYTFTFDEELPVVYVSGSFGYAVINYLTGETERIVPLDKAVSWAARVGDYMVVFSGTMSTGGYSTSTYLFPKDEVPTSLSTPAVAYDNLQALMVLTPTTFAAMSQGSTEKQSNLKHFRISNGRLVETVLAENITVDDAATSNYRHMFRTDGFWYPTAEGYAVTGNSDIIMLKKGIPLESTSASAVNEFREQALTRIAKGTLSATERETKCGTLDGKTVWFFTYDDAGLNVNPRGFYTREFASNRWGDKSEIHAPLAPTSLAHAFADWNEEKGLVVRGPSVFFDTDGPERDCIARYSDGKWSDISTYANNPNYKDLDPTMWDKYVAFDPLNSDWIWGASRFFGLSRINMSDYSNFFGIGCTYHNAYEATAPGFFAVMPQISDYTSYMNISNVSFDNAGRMWFGRAMYKKTTYMYQDITQSYTPLYYLTADERKALANIGTDKSKLPDIMGRELQIRETAMQGVSWINALKAKENENILAIIPNWFLSEKAQFGLYDHNGTPENPKDDRYCVVRELEDEEGNKVQKMYDLYAYEDVKTGEVWWCTSYGPYIIKPAEILAGSKACRRPYVTRREGRTVHENPFEQVSITYISEDLYGRRWIASRSGLYCLSADGEELLGEYHTENSGLPHDYVMSVVCDGATGAVYALTKRGLAEFRPEGTPSARLTETGMSATPAIVGPHYNGYVTISGLSTGEEYEVVDAQGDVVVSLGRASSPLLQWNCKDADGKRVSSGRYGVRRAGSAATATLTVL